MSASRTHRSSSSATCAGVPTATGPSPPMDAVSAMTRGVMDGSSGVRAVSVSLIEWILCFSSACFSGSISSSSGTLEMSMPVQPEKSTSPPIVEAYFFALANFSCASSSVRPMMGVNVAKNLMERGSRPAAWASSRILATRGVSTDGLWPETKTASA
ncbi:hypothetical protein VTN96DRAFT_3134 [Rasamsonia emersonii]